jgi:hypothetical protein
MQERHVIGLHPAIDRVFPIDPRRGAIAGEQGEAAQIHIGQHALHRAQECVEIDMAFRLGVHDDHADILRRRQRDQTAQLLRLEGLAAGDRDQVALGVVGPAVIGASKALGMAAALGQLDPAMAAGIQEGLGLPILTAHDQDRLAGDIGGVIIARVRQVGTECDELRPLEEQLLLFQLEPLLVDETADIQLDRLRPHGGFVGVNQL